MKVTTFLKYDLYPYYSVMEGDLQENFDVKTSCGTFNSTKVLNIRPIQELKDHKDTHTRIRHEHDRLLRKLKVDLLQQNGINFINTDSF